MDYNILRKHLFGWQMGALASIDNALMNSSVHRVCTALQVLDDGELPIGWVKTMVIGNEVSIGNDDGYNWRCRILLDDDGEFASLTGGCCYGSSVEIAPDFVRVNTIRHYAELSLKEDRSFHWDADGVPSNQAWGDSIYFDYVDEIELKLHRIDTLCVC